jgi:hypothetical protein
MSEIDDLEHPENHRESDRHQRVKAAVDQTIRQQVES